MSLWLPGAKKVEAWKDGGSMVGGPKRVIWHSTENDPKKTTAKTIADYLNRIGYQVHLVWNPITGEMVQMIPADRAGRGLENRAGWVQTNREGDVCVQIEVVAHASKPFTDYEMKGREQIMDWVRSLGVPDVWPGGPPPAAPGTTHVSSTVWNHKAGHYSHSQTPENDHNDPGAIDIRKLFGEHVPLDDKDVEKIFQTDGILDNPVKDPKNPKVRPAWLLTDTNQKIREIEDLLAKVAKKVGA